MSGLGTAIKEVSGPLTAPMWGALGIGAAGTLLGGYGEYSSGMAQANALDASRPYDLINAANRATGLRYGADTALAGAQRQAQERVTDKNLLLSKSRAMSAAGGGGSDTSVINQEALIERQGAFFQALEMFGGQEQANQLNYESQNALLEGVNTYNAKGVAASRTRSAARMQAVGTLLQGGSEGLKLYGKLRYPKRRLPGDPDYQD